jgi:SAM-dependent methyltransferase
MLGRISKYRDRLAQHFDIETRPDLSFIRSALRRALQDHLTEDDSADKKAVLVGDSVALARMLGLKKTQLLIFSYPDFTLENLALLSEEYDFVISDRALHRCGNLDDAARETIRVLRPGGWFVHTTSLLDVDTGARRDWRRCRPPELEKLFSSASSCAAGGWGSLGSHALVSWIVGRKTSPTPALIPTVATRKSRRRWYTYKPRAAKFGVVAAVRNEAPYLLEWIAHYRMLGFQQITIYDNQSNDTSARILAPLARAGIINAMYWSDRPAKQRRAYSNAIRKLQPYVEWCLFADLDEFLILDPGLSLADLLPKDPDVSAVAIPWRMYGSAGLRNRSPEPVIERFTRAAPDNEHLVKSLVRLRDVERMSLHIPKIFTGRIVDVSGAPVDAGTRGLLPQPAHGPARINHYFNRSWEEFTCKRARGRGAVPGGFHDVESFDKVGPGAVELPDALRLVPAVKQEIARLRRIIGGS